VRFARDIDTNISCDEIVFFFLLYMEIVSHRLFIKCVKLASDFITPQITTVLLKMPEFS
jgi:hypothetical protein